MADDDQPTPSRSAADKEKSRQQSRPVSGKAASPSKGGGAKGQGNRPSGSKAPANRAPASKAQGGRAAGNRPAGGGRPGQRGAPEPQSRSWATLATLGVVVLVVILVVVLVVVKITKGSTTSSGPSAFTPAPASVVDDVTHIPASVYNTVGTSSSEAPVTPPTITHGQKPLTFDGLPGAFYFGAEYCPYCAAERWAIIAATSRFGTWSNLGEMESSSSDVYPSTQTFTFAKATFTSPYLVFKTDEYYSNQAASSGQGYQLLQQPTKEELDLVNTYDGPTFFPGESGTGSFPFVSIGNKALVSGASYSPAILGGLSREQIASGLDDPTNPVTQAIVATSNYLSASICATNGGKPASVCQSKGVTGAASKLGLS